MRISPADRGSGMTSRRTRERLVQRLRDAGIRDPRVLELIRDTPRHLFVDEALASRAYEDSALPIGHGQTISQPYIVARMTEALVEAGPPERVLEVGAGCGYQTAILAQLSRQVFAVERIGALVERARDRMRDLDLRNVQFRHADGASGWPQQAPFDAILVAAAPEDVPPSLLAQLAPGGRLVIPVGPGGSQRLVRITCGADGARREDLEAVSFVPLLGGRQ